MLKYMIMIVMMMMIMMTTIIVTMTNSIQGEARSIIGTTALYLSFLSVVKIPLRVVIF